MWQEYMEELNQKILMIQITMKVHTFIHLKPDILESEVKWALGSITTNKVVEVTEFQLSYFKS